MATHDSRRFARLHVDRDVAVVVATVVTVTLGGGAVLSAVAWSWTPILVAAVLTVCTSLGVAALGGLARFYGWLFDRIWGDRL